MKYLKTFESYNDNLKGLNETYETDLQSYVEGQTKYEPIMNILMGPNRKKNYYAELGRYIMESLSENYPSNLFVVTGHHYDDKSDKGLANIAIMFLTGTLKSDVLNTMFGKPIFHNEFGEGFEDGNKYEFASHFVDINGIPLHIGYDHRGTSTEIKDGTDADTTLSALKGLVDKFKETGIGSDRH